MKSTACFDVTEQMSKESEKSNQILWTSQNIMNLKNYFLNEMISAK